jgi:hypothetical protein
MGEFMVDLFLNFVGRVCLYIMYRDSEKVEKVLNIKYHGQFDVAGWVFATDLFIGICVLMLVGGLVLGIFSSIRQAIIK